MVMSELHKAKLKAGREAAKLRRVSIPADVDNTGAPSITSVYNDDNQESPIPFELKSLRDSLDLLTEKVIFIENILKTPPSINQPTQARTLEGTTQISLDKEGLPKESGSSLFSPSLHPVPMEYRDIVDSVLNKAFGVNVEALSDTPAFKFIIIVPDKYSSATVEQKRMVGGYDIRPKVINYAEGGNGVRLWSEKVFSSFNPEIKAQIVSDRSQLN